VRVEGHGRGCEYFAASPVDAPIDPETTATEAPADNALAVSTVDEGVRDNVRDLLRSGPLQREELVSELADIEGHSETDAGHEVETLLREGLLTETDGAIEWADHRDPTSFAGEPEPPAARVVF
jgi:hypothetical protein